MNVIARTNLSSSIVGILRGMIVDGELPAGDRVNEVHLARRLAVSRTPLREALNRLATEGALEARPHFGYFVRALTVEEFEQVYDIRPLLDPEALRLAGLPRRPQLERLEALNRRLATARTSAAAIDLDDAWHLVLLENCPNRVLVELIENMMLRTRRYELALMRDTDQVTGASECHEQILAALKKGDLERACSALRANLTSGKAPMIAWLKARQVPSRSLEAA